MRQADPAGDVMPPAELVRRDRWRPAEPAQVAPVGPALVISSAADPFSTGPRSRWPRSTPPLPVPVAVAGAG